MDGEETKLSVVATSRVNKGDYTRDYKLSRTLGQGSFAKVRIGKCKKDNTTWAIKIIDRKALTREDADALGVEVDAMLRVHHKNIVKLREVYDAPHQFVMVLELCTGGELFDRIVAHEHYTEKDGQTAFAQMTEAIGHCHEHGIVHRDLKPENLLYEAPEPNEVIKLADFGLAAMLKPDAALMTSCGTPGYVAPEILTGNGYNIEVDEWSLGVILYILLCGFPPFYHENQGQLFKDIKRGHFEFPSPYWDGISESAKDLIRRLLIVDPKQRLTCEQIFQQPWMTEIAASVHLPHFASSMHAYNARRKFRGAQQAVLSTIRMAKAMGH